MFSYVLFYYGESECSKNTCIHLSIMNCSCSLISFPWSKVNLFLSSSGNVLIASEYLFLHGKHFFGYPIGTRIVLRVVQFTRVPRVLRLYFPNFISPSQYSGTVQSATSSDYSLIDSILAILPRFFPLFYVLRCLCSWCKAFINVYFGSPLERA